MKNLKLILTYIFGIVMILGGIAHFVSPEQYFAFIPAYLPPYIINYLGGIAEILVGFGVFIPKYRKTATLGILILLLLFLCLAKIYIIQILNQFYLYNI